MTDVDTGAPPATAGGGMQDFITAVLRDQIGNAVIARSGGRLPSGRPKVNRPKWFRYPEQLPQMVAYAEAYAKEDLYLSPIVYGEKKDREGEPSRAADNALTSQTVYMDSDECPPSAYRLTPSIHVDTSPGRGHDYWVLPAPIPASESAALGHKIAIAHRKDGTDPSGWSASKYLRLPTVNRSYGDPIPVRWHDSGEVYTDLDIAGSYDDIDLPALPMARPDDAAPAAKPASGGRPDLLEKTALAPLYDRIPATAYKLTDLLEHKPQVGEKGWRSEQRWALLLELARHGFTEQEAMSLAWHAAASGKWWEDPRGLDGLWYELQKAYIQVRGEGGANVPAIDRSTKTTRAPKLLSPTEIARARAQRTFVGEYLTWAKSRVPVLNLPLHEMNAWTALSAAYAPVGQVWRKTDLLPLNIYVIEVSPSSSGKSEASRMMRRVVNRLYPHDSVMIGADHSRNNLIQVLNERDGMVSIAQSDEADETLKTQGGSTNWASGMQQAWTEVYDGEVPTQGRIGDKNPRRTRAKALVLMHLIGTPDGMYQTIDRGMFKSGFLARFLWAEGVKIPATRDSMRYVPRSQQTEAITDHDLFPRYWQTQVAINRRRVMNLADPKAVDMDFTVEAAERISEANFDLISKMGGLGDDSVLSPIATRMVDYAFKASALIALQAGRAYVTLPDVLVALDAVQTWLDTAVRVVDKIAASAFSRACDDVEAFIASREAQEATSAAIYSFMRGVRIRDVDEYIQSLVLQGRVEAMRTTGDGPRRYKIKGVL